MKISTIRIAAAIAPFIRSQSEVMRSRPISLVRKDGSIARKDTFKNVQQSLLRRADIELPPENGVRPRFINCEECGLRVKVKKVGPIPTLCKLGSGCKPVADGVTARMVSDRMRDLGWDEKRARMTPNAEDTMFASAVDHMISSGEVRDGDDLARSMNSFFGLAMKIAKLQFRHHTSVITRSGLGAKRAKGERTGECPFGFRAVPGSKLLEPEPRELTVLAEVRALRAAGLSVRAVMGALASRGFVSVRTGQPFKKSQVHELTRMAAQTWWEPLWAAVLAAKKDDE